MLQLSCKFDESIWNPYWLTVLTSSSDSNYVPNKYEDVDQYDPYVILFDIMPCLSYPESLLNQNGIPVDLSRQRAHLALVMSLTSMTILTNMAHLQSHPR